MKGEPVGEGGIGKVQAGGAGTGWLTHRGHQPHGAQPGLRSLRGQGEAEYLRLLWPESSLPAQVESPRFSDKQTEARGGGGGGRLRPAVTPHRYRNVLDLGVWSQGDIAHLGGAP